MDLINTILITIATLIFFIRVYIQDGKKHSIFKRYLNLKYFLPISNKENISSKGKINKLMYCFYTLIITTLIINIFYLVTNIK